MESHREEIAKLEALYAAHPEGRVFTHLAEAYRRAGELDRAREILEDGLRRHPDYSSAHVVLGRVLLDREENDGAAAAFRRVLELDRHNLVALRSLGDLAERAGDAVAAVGYYRDLVALDPADDRLRLTVARLEGELDSPAPAAGPSVAFETAPGPEPAAVPEPLDIESFEAVDVEDAEELPALDFPSLADNPTEIDAEEEVVLEVEGLSLGWGDETADESIATGEDAEPTLDSAVQDLAGEELETDRLAEPVAQLADEPGEAAHEVPAVGWLQVEEGHAEEAAEPAAVEAEGDADVPDTDWTSVEERAAAAWRGEEAAVEGSSAEAGEAAILELEETFDVVFEPDSTENVLETDEDDSAPFAPSTFADVADAPAEAPAMLDAEAAEAEDDAVVTATMAELYAQQGFYDRATDVYRQLLEQVPEDDRLRERLEEIEALSAGPGGAAAATPMGDVEDAGDADEWTSVDAWTEHADVAGEEETPYAWAETEAEVEEGPSAGEYFASLLAWRPATRTLELTAEDETGEPSAAAEATVLETGAVEAAYEEWFGEAPDAEGGTEPEAEGDADLEMFRSWLQSLKK